MIDNWLPAFDVRERHELGLDISPEQALRLVLAVPAAPDAFIRTLFRFRGMRPDGSIYHFVLANGFTVLEQTPTSFAVGVVAPRRRALPDAVSWTESHSPRTVKIAAAFWAERRSTGSCLITETRVAATDSYARVAFRLYWLFVGPFSKLIRRRWLDAAAAMVHRDS